MNYRQVQAKLKKLKGKRRSKFLKKYLDAQELATFVVKRMNILTLELLRKNTNLTYEQARDLCANEVNIAYGVEITFT